MTNANAQPPSSAAVPAVGAVNARRLPVEPTNTDAYSQAQFAKPGIPRTHWNQSDQDKRVLGLLPTKCGCSRLVVSVTDTGLRCYRLSITGYQTVIVDPAKDAFAVLELRAIVPNLDSLPTREVVEFDPICDVTYRPVTEFGRTRKVMETITQRTPTPKKEEPVKPVDDLPPGMTQQLAPKSDVDTWFGPKTAKRAPWGAEGDGVKVDSKPFSVKNHFRRELLKLRPDADPAAVAYVILSATVEESCEKIGVSPTIDKLQEHLVYLESNPMTAPATVASFQVEVANLISDAFPLASSEYKRSIMKSATGHISIDAAKKAGMTEMNIKTAIRDEIDTIKSLERNLPPADESETHAVDAASAPVAPTEATPVPATPVGATAAKAEGQSVPSVAFPNWPESPVTCWPDPGGSVIHKGIRFNVSFRVGGCWELLIPLMDGFAAHRECIDPSCIVRQPMQTAATGGSTAPRDEDAPPDDDEPGEPQFQSGGGEEHENGTAIMRSVEGNKTTYTIWYNVGSGAETKWPKKIGAPQAVKLLETSLRAAGRNPDKWENGKRYNSVKVNVWWKQGKQIEGTSKHYTDYTRFEVVKEVEEVPA